MTECAVFHILHDLRADAWKVERKGSPRAIVTAETRDDAIDAAKERVQSIGQGRVIVHRKDGSIESEYAYGVDARTVFG